MLEEESLELSKALIQCKSITPKDDGALEVLSKYLTKLGFVCNQVTFSESGTPEVKNLYAKLGSSSPNICFAGHTDVVDHGNKKDWLSKPFEPTIRDAMLFGRGAADMKCAIAAFAVATKIFQKNIGATFSGSISFLITGDEEGPAINGTKKMIDWLKRQGEVLDHCIVGEPTSSHRLGDMVKIGRRGSLNASITITGTQGHVAYPDLAINPVPHLIKFLHSINKKVWDNGNNHFQPTNLEITSVKIENTITNIIPKEGSAQLNIRFNNLHTGESIKKYLKKVQKKISIPSTIGISVSGEAFLTSPGFLTNTIASAINFNNGFNPKLTTTGGTSDARFIKNICPVCEFGMLNTTAHKVDEHVALKDIFSLTKIYTKFLELYFSRT